MMVSRSLEMEITKYQVDFILAKMGCILGCTHVVPYRWDVWAESCRNRAELKDFYSNSTRNELYRTIGMLLIVRNT